MRERYDVMAVGAHPDDVEAIMGGTVAKLVRRGLSVLLVDLCSGEPARHAAAGVRAEQAARAAEILGADRVTLGLQDRLIRDTPENGVAVAQLIRRHKPGYVFTSAGCGVHPDHKAVTEIVAAAVFYARSRSGTKCLEARCWRKPTRMRSSGSSSAIAAWNRHGNGSTSPLTSPTSSR